MVCVSGWSRPWAMAMPYLSWQTIVVGDPLCAPFRDSPLAREQIDKGLDSLTELPRLFSARRVEHVSAPGTSPEILRLLLRAGARLARDDRSGARAALEDALRVDPQLVAAERLLAMLDEAEQQYESATQRYRRILQQAPNDAAVLNNFAYPLAPRLRKPQDALPLAERAAKLSPRDAYVADTLAWVHHLVGNNQKAALLVEQALKLGPTEPELLLHAAAIHFALGNRVAAQRDLNESLRLSPDLATREDVVRLQAELMKIKTDR